MTIRKFLGCAAALALASMLLVLGTAAAQPLSVLTAQLNTAQEVPAVNASTPTAASGSALMSFDTVSGTLSWSINFSGLSGDAVRMHFHAPAMPGETADVVINIGDRSGLSSPSVGSIDGFDAELTRTLLSGLWYINIHTELNQPGEIRGQVIASSNSIPLISSLDQAQEVPAPSDVPGAMGNARLAYDPQSNQLGWHIIFEGLSGNPVGMHFHGPAEPGETADVKINIGEISGLRSPSTGSTVLTEQEEAQLLGGQWYINIHTEANRSGEIRGQVLLDQKIFADQFELSVSEK